MNNLREEYVRQHEEISNTEFELMDLITEDDVEKIRDKVNDLKTKHDEHIGFEEQHLFPLLENEVPDELLKYLKEEHMDLFEKIQEIHEKVHSNNYKKVEILEMVSRLEGIHTSHINSETKFLYPKLNKIDKSEVQETLKRYQEQEYENYTPIKARSNKNK